tara:strand:+ start:1869 stop:3662 length:1794 start_codon:yes stop_codon:yes gene_type:complete
MTLEKKLQEILFLINQEKYKELIPKIHELLKEKYQSIPLYGNLGLSYLKLNKNYLAIKYFLKVKKIDKNNINANHNLGLAYSKINEIDKAINCYDQALEAIEEYPFFFITLIEYLELLLANYKINLAEKIIYKYKDKIPIDLQFFFNTALFDIKFKNHRSFVNNIKKIEDMISDYQTQITINNKFIITELNRLIKFIPPTIFTTTFYIENPKKLLKKYYQIFDKITDSFNIPKLFSPPISKNKKIKVGFASSIFRKHTITKLFKNWIIKLDKNKFDVYIIDLDSEKDEIYNEIKNNAVETILTNRNLEENINFIRAKKLDYIIYLDNHISRKASALYNFQLASKQAVTWGHPVTSGSKYIDLFLSSELMENSLSEKNYTEKLIKLKNISINYEKPNIEINEEIKNRFDDNFVNILNLQSLHKFQPHEDKIYAEILNKNKKINLYFIESEIKEHNKVFKYRISKFLSENKSEERIKFLPRCDNNNFYNYIYFSSFIFDCLSWSGGNTHLEALAFDKPIITMEGKNLKQNHTFGFLKRINQNHLIASNEREYIDKILEFSKSKNLVNKSKEEISNNKNLLFRDMECIKSLEDSLMKNLF